MNVSETLKRLKEENPEALADSVDKKFLEVDLIKINGTTTPSEIKKMADAIKTKRLTAPGLSDAELRDLMRRIGK